MSAIQCPSAAWDDYYHSQHSHCDVCQNKEELCVCPECPVCHTIGDPACYGTHVGEIQQCYEFTVIWDNGHPSDTLGTFSTRKDAENAGEDWLIQMAGADPDCDDYSYEILDPVEVNPTKEAILEAHKNVKEEQ